MPRKTGVGAERVLLEIRQGIVNGVYPAHSYLPAERLLSQRFNVGRAVVRRALDGLEQQGYIDRAHGRGTQVLPAEGRTERPRIAIAHNHWRAWGSQEPARIFDGAAETFSRLGYDVDRVNLITASPSLYRKEDGPTLPTEKLESLAGEYHAVLLIECSSDVLARQAIALEARRYPLVVANLENDLPLTATRVNHAAVMEEAAGLLAGMGHSRIGFCAYNAGLYFYGAAFEGFRRGVASAGLDVDEDLILFTEYEEQRNEVALAMRIMRWLDSVPRPPTAIVAGRDRYAGVICGVLEQMGLAVGRDVSVVSYDDVSWPVEKPFLTTFREPCRDLGRVAAEMLHERIVHGWRPVEQRVLDAPLILRRSAGPLHAQPAEPAEPASAKGATAHR